MQISPLKTNLLARQNYAIQKITVLYWSMESTWKLILILINKKKKLNNLKLTMAIHSEMVTDEVKDEHVLFLAKYVYCKSR